MMETPRYTISELHFGKFSDSSDFQCWRVNFKIEVCLCTPLLNAQMSWINEVDGKINRRSYDAVDHRV